MLTIQCVKLNWKSALVWQGPVLDKLDNDTLSLISDTKQSIPINRSAASINGLVRAQSSAQQIELSPLLLGRYDMPGVPCLQSAWIPNNHKIPKNGSSLSIRVQVLSNITRLSCVPGLASRVAVGPLSYLNWRFCWFILKAGTSTVGAFQ